MDLALYDPAGGYYRASTARPGRDGDFLTAPEAHPIFGAALSRAVADAWDRLDRPVPFVLREHGAGTGALAVAILDGLAAERPDLAAVIGYQPVEVEPARIDALAARLTAAGHGPALTRGGATEATGLAVPITGFILANEVLDALPTHRVDRPRGRPPRGPGRFGGRDLRRRGGRPVDARAAGPSRRRGHHPGGGSARRGLPRRRWLDRGAWRPGSERGLVLLIDYGYPASELYDPVRRRDGTLRAYLRHRVHDDPYVHVGRQDLTAHVDVTAVERAAAAAGLDHLGTTTQAEYLVGLGTESLLQAIQADPATTIEGYLAVRSALMRLLDPSAMGRFRVMAFGRAWPAGPPPAGFDYRLRRGDRQAPAG